MSNRIVEKVGWMGWLRNHCGSLALTGAAGIALMLAGTLTGCQSPKGKSPNADVQAVTNADKAVESGPVVLREGDAVEITFPGAPNLNATRVVRQDGFIALNLVGELNVAGMTAEDLKKKLLEVYDKELVVKEVTVSINSGFPIYVTGAVLQPGKITPSRPLTVLEAIMEANGPDWNKANLKDVQVIRQENGRSKVYHLNLKNVVKGLPSPPFTLHRSDMIYVPEKFNWF